MLRKMLKNQKGQGLVEYALIIALVAVVLVVGIGTFKDKIADVFKDIGTKISPAA